MVDEFVRKIGTISNNLMPHVLIDYGLDRGLSASITLNNFIVDIDLIISQEKTDSTLGIVINRIINIFIFRKRMIVKMKYKDDGLDFNNTEAPKVKKGIEISPLLNRLTYNITKLR